MLPIVNRPMIEHVVGHLVDHGVDDVVLSLGYQPDGFRDAYPGGRCAGATLHYAIEPEPLDTAGAIRFAALDAAIDERFLVVNGDVLTDLDVTAFVAFHDARAAEGTISLHRVDDPSRYGVVLTDGRGRVSAFVEKPPRGEAASDLINAGTYVLEPSVIDRIPPGRRVSVERETFPTMAADGSLYALRRRLLLDRHRHALRVHPGPARSCRRGARRGGRRRPPRRACRRRCRGQAFGRRGRCRRRRRRPGRELGAAPPGKSVLRRRDRWIGSGRGCGRGGGRQGPARQRGR